MQYVFFAFLIILLIIISVELLRKYVSLSHGILCLISGIVIGPFGLKLLDSSEYLEIFAEVGILLLMFSIGLEVSFRRLKSMRHLILGLGVLHSALMIFASILFLLIFRSYEMKWIIIIGITLSFSSTAVAIQILSERKELNSKIGKLSFAILLLQDIIAVLLFMMMGILSSDSSHSMNNSSIEIKDGIMFVMLTSLLVVIIVASPKWIGRIVQHINHDYRPLFVLSAVLGASIITQFLNLSSDLGAFIIGMCCASTPWAHEISDIIAPYRIFTLSIFFILVGVQMNMSFILNNMYSIITWLSFIVLTKLALTIMLMRLVYKLSWSKSCNMSILLTGCGEFAFVIFSNNWVDKHLSQESCALWTTITGISMIITPIMYTIYRSSLHKIIAKKLDGLTENACDHSDIYNGKINPALAPVLVENEEYDITNDI